MNIRTTPILFISATAWVIGSPGLRADIPSALEPKYAEAVLAYNAKQFSQSINLLKSLLSKSPDLPEFLELEALSFKGAKQDAKAAEVYARLLEVKKSSPASERAPYQFELGSLHFKAGELAEAEPEFQGSLDGGFNPGVAHFFLGMIAYRQKNWLAAEDHLEKFRAASVPDLRPAASLYLAQAYSESGYGLGAVQAYFDARQASDESIQDPSSSPESLASSKSVLDAANQGLAPVTPGRFFSDVGLLFGYDSNVLSQPSGQTSGLAQQTGGGTATNGAAQASGQASPEATLLAGIGYMTSPLSSLQLVPSYRLRMNYGDSAAVAGNFASNTLSLYINHFPLSRLSYGVKIEGSLILEEQIDDPTTDARSFHPYVLSGAVGPYARWQFNPYWVMNAELFVQPQKNYTDDQTPNSPALLQSGQAYHAKVGIKKTGGSRFFNPGFYLANDFNNTSGTQFRSETPDLGVDNDFKIGDKISMVVGADLGTPIYSSAFPDRVDKTASMYLSLTWAVWQKLTVLSTASYTSNRSNSSDNNNDYAYDRGTISCGASWSIF